MRDPFDLMTYYQTEILCQAFTDVEKLKISDQELQIKDKVTELYKAV